MGGGVEGVWEGCGKGCRRRFSKRVGWEVW